MAINDTKLKSILNKLYSGAPELTDGDGLGARISQKGTIDFQFRYGWDGKQQRITLGRYPVISLSDARVGVGESRILKGVDPKIHFKSNDSDLTLNDCLDYGMDKSVAYNNLYDQFPETPIKDINIRDRVTYFEVPEKINLKRARHILVQAKSAINFGANSTDGRKIANII